MNDKSDDDHKESDKEQLLSNNKEEDKDEMDNKDDKDTEDDDNTKDAHDDDDKKDGEADKISGAVGKFATNCLTSAMTKVVSAIGGKLESMVKTDEDPIIDPCVVAFGQDAAPAELASPGMKPSHRKDTVIVKKANPLAKSQRMCTYCNLPCDKDKIWRCMDETCKTVRICDNCKNTKNLNHEFTDKKVDWAFSCDGCGSCPLVGERHKCMNKECSENKDYCEPCFLDKVHSSGHVVTLIKDMNTLKQIQQVQQEKEAQAQAEQEAEEAANEEEGKDGQDGQDQEGLQEEGVKEGDGDGDGDGDGEGQGEGEDGGEREGEGERDGKADQSKDQQKPQAQPPAQQQPVVTKAPENPQEKQQAPEAAAQGPAQENQTCTACQSILVFGKDEIYKCSHKECDAKFLCKKCKDPHLKHDLYNVKSVGDNCLYDGQPATRWCLLCFYCCCNDCYSTDPRCDHYMIPRNKRVKDGDEIYDCDYRKRCKKDEEFRSKVLDLINKEFDVMKSDIYQAWQKVKEKEKAQKEAEKLAKEQQKAYNPDNEEDEDEDEEEQEEEEEEEDTEVQINAKGEEEMEANKLENKLKFQLAKQLGINAAAVEYFYSTPRKDRDEHKTKHPDKLILYETLFIISTKTFHKLQQHMDSKEFYKLVVFRLEANMQSMRIPESPPPNWGGYKFKNSKNLEHYKNEKLLQVHFRLGYPHEAHHKEFVADVYAPTFMCQLNRILGPYLNHLHGQVKPHGHHTMKMFHCEQAKCDLCPERHFIIPMTVTADSCEAEQGDDGEDDDDENDDDDPEKKSEQSVSSDAEGEGEGEREEEKDGEEKKEKEGDKPKEENPSDPAVADGAPQMPFEYITIHGHEVKHENNREMTMTMNLRICWFPSILRERDFEAKRHVPKKKKDAHDDHKDAHKDDKDKKGDAHRDKNHDKKDSKGSSKDPHKEDKEAGDHKGGKKGGADPSAIMKQAEAAAKKNAKRFVEFLKVWQNVQLPPLAFLFRTVWILIFIGVATHIFPLPVDLFILIIFFGYADAEPLVFGKDLQDQKPKNVIYNLIVLAWLAGLIFLAGLLEGNILDGFADVIIFSFIFELAILSNASIQLQKEILVDLGSKEETIKLEAQANSDDDDSDKSLHYLIHKFYKELDTRTAVEVASACREFTHEREQHKEEIATLETACSVGLILNAGILGFSKYVSVPFLNQFFTDPSAKVNNLMGGYGFEIAMIILLTEGAFLLIYKVILSFYITQQCDAMVEDIEHARQTLDYVEEIPELIIWAREEVFPAKISEETQVNLDLLDFKSNKMGVKFSKYNREETDRILEAIYAQVAADNSSHLFNVKEMKKKIEIASHMCQIRIKTVEEEVIDLVGVLQYKFLGIYKIDQSFMLKAKTAIVSAVSGIVLNYVQSQGVST